MNLDWHPMMIKYYLITCAITLAVFVFLRFVEDSPVRSWNTVWICWAGVSLVVCLYLRWVIPKPVPPAPVARKVENYRAELERHFRHIEGVESASITGSNVVINFAHDLPLERIKQIARSSGGTAAYFLRGTNKNFELEILMTVQGMRRFRLIFEPGRISEKVY